jgi:hypothetical protein
VTEYRLTRTAQLALLLAHDRPVRPTEITHVHVDEASITPPVDGRPYAPERWETDMFGICQSSPPPAGGYGRLGDGRYFRAISFAVRQVWPFDTEVGVVGTVTGEGTLERFWFVSEPGHEATNAERTRAVRGLGLMDARLTAARKDVIEAGELLGNLFRSAADLKREQRRLAYEWLLWDWERRPGRTQFDQYLKRFGWTWPELKKLLPKTPKNRTKRRAERPHHEDREVQDAAIPSRDRRAGFQKSGRPGPRREATGESSGELVARERDQKAGNATAA